jgi:hypothetical protein
LGARAEAVLLADVVVLLALSFLHEAARVVEFELIYGLLRVAVTGFIRIFFLASEISCAREWNILALIWRFLESLLNTVIS